MGCADLRTGVDVEYGHGKEYDSLAVRALMSHVIRAVYEQGVLKPLERVQLVERQIFLVSIYPEDQWREDFDVLLKRTHRRTRRSTSQEIEADITAARAEVRDKRRATRRAV